MKFMFFVYILLSWILNLCQCYPDKYYTNGFTVKLKRKEDLTYVSDSLREKSFVYVEKIVSTNYYYIREGIIKSSEFPFNPPYIEHVRDSLKDYVVWIEQSFERVIDPYYSAASVVPDIDLLEDEYTCGDDDINNVLLLGDTPWDENTVSYSNENQRTGTLKQNEKDDYSRETRTPKIISYNSPRPIRVAVADVGFQLDHPALQSSVNKNLSFDFVDNDHVPELNNEILNDVLGDVRRRGDFLSISHGTMCMGRIAAEQIDGCDPGVAQDAEIVGYRIIHLTYHQLLTTIPDMIEAKALVHDIDEIDVMSCSYGAPENAGFVKLSSNVIEALSEGITQGRECRGRIYVHPSGNGNHDNCNTDGYANSIDTITIANVKRNGQLPNNKEICTCTLAAATGEGYVTTALGSQCVPDFAGSSAATAEAAGIIAEVLKVNYLLSKRDIEHLIVQTATTQLVKTDAWKTNGVGHKYHNQIGFGKLDVEEMKRKASTWKFLPPKRICRVQNYGQKITSSTDLRESLSHPITSLSCSGTDNRVRYIEHVQLSISIQCTDITQVALSLISPSGTASNLLTQMIIKNENFKKFSLQKWKFMSVQFWGEDPEGQWSVQLSVHELSVPVSCKMDIHELIFHGTDEDPTQGGEPQTCEETESKHEYEESNDKPTVRTNSAPEVVHVGYIIGVTALSIALVLSAVVVGYYFVIPWYKRRHFIPVETNKVKYRRRRTISKENEAFQGSSLFAEQE